MACCGKGNSSSQGVSMKAPKEGFVALTYIGNEIVEKSLWCGATGAHVLIGTAHPVIYVHPGDQEKLLRMTVQGNPQFAINVSAQSASEPVETVPTGDAVDFLDNFDSGDDEEYFDFSSLSGIGESTKDRLHEVGYTTLDSVVADSEDDFKEKMGERFTKSASKVYETILEAFNTQ